MSTVTLAESLDSAVPVVEALPRPLVSKPMREIFNSTVVAYAISAAIEAGVFDRLRDMGMVDAGEFARERGWRPEVTRSVLETLTAADIVRADTNGTFRCGQAFESADYARPFFYWLIRGNGRLLSSLPDFAQGQRVPLLAGEDDWGRDMRAVARASRMGGELYLDRTMDLALAGVDYSAVADLGCGSGARLLKLVDRSPGVAGLGLDIAASVISMARQNARDRGLSDRVRFLQEDVTALTARREFSGIDLLTCFLLGHDFWPRADAVSTLIRLRESFPDVRHLIICDECRLPEPLTLDNTIFTMGFQLAHAAMGKVIPTVEAWQEVFAESGWRCTLMVRSGHPNSNVAFRLEPMG